MDDSKGNAKRKVLVVEDNEPNKKSCPHAMKGDGRSAATPIGRLLNASSEPGSPTKDAKLHLSNGVDASAQGPNVPAHRDLSPRVAGLHTEPGDEGDEAEGQFYVEPHPHPVEDEMTAETASNDGGTIEVPRGTERLRTEKLWVLRSTLTLKATDTTLMSVDGAIGQKGVLLYTCHMTVPER